MAERRDECLPELRRALHRRSSAESVASLPSTSRKPGSIYTRAQFGSQRSTDNDKYASIATKQPNAKSNPSHNCNPTTKS